MLGTLVPAQAALYSYRGPNGRMFITDKPINKPGYQLVDTTRKAPKKGTPASSSGTSLSKSQIATLVAPIAATYQVDPKLVEAVIEVESARNPLARSHKGALGLMQLIPDTAKRFGVSNPFAAAENIKGGVRYLHFLLGYFEGDVDHVLAAYNAGEHAVDRFGGVPPYRETRQYIKKVRKLYGEKTAPFNPDISYRSVLIKESGKPPVKPIARKTSTATPLASNKEATP
jgi:soluble lytic murein transglycosylase-like protein